MWRTKLILSLMNQPIIEFFDKTRQSNYGEWSKWLNVFSERKYVFQFHIEIQIKYCNGLLKREKPPIWIHSDKFRNSCSETIKLSVTPGWNIAPEGFKAVNMHKSCRTHYEWKYQQKESAAKFSEPTSGGSEKLATWKMVEEKRILPFPLSSVKVILIVIIFL